MTLDISSTISSYISVLLQTLRHKFIHLWALIWISLIIIFYISDILYSREIIAMTFNMEFWLFFFYTILWILWLKIWNPTFKEKSFYLLSMTIYFNFWFTIMNYPKDYRKKNKIWSIILLSFVCFNKCLKIFFMYLFKNFLFLY